MRARADDGYYCVEKIYGRHNFRRDIGSASRVCSTRRVGAVTRQVDQRYVCQVDGSYARAIAVYKYSGTQ